jgi:hypothetical protein
VQEIDERNLPPNISKLILVQTGTETAPNISLNLHKHTGRGELHAVAVFGIILQIGVLAYSGFATYHPRLQFPKGENLVQSYAFPVTAVGTLVLVTGMLICSHVVERSTEEKRYQAKDGVPARILCLQKASTFNDQTFDSFAIFAKGERSIIITSQRDDRKTSDHNEKTENEDQTTESPEFSEKPPISSEILAVLAPYPASSDLSPNLLGCGACIGLLLLHSWVQH